MRETHTEHYRVLACYSYFLTYGEDEELTDDELSDIQLFLEGVLPEEAPDGYSLAHTSVEPEQWSGDYGTCDITGSWGERAVLTAVYFKD
jgi:hypothetical protein